MPSKSLRKCLDEALDVFRDRFVFLRRSQFRQHVGVCEHVEAERSGERSALNAEPADVLCGRLLNAESEEVPGGEGLEVFDFLHDVQAIKKAPGCAEGLMKCRRLEKQFLYGGGGDQFDRPQRQRHRFLFGESFEFVDEPLGSNGLQ